MIPVWAAQMAAAGVAQGIGSLMGASDRRRNERAIADQQARLLGLASTYQTRAESIPNYLFQTNEAMATQGRNMFMSQLDESGAKAKAQLGRAYSGLNRGSTALARGISQVGNRTQDASNQYDYQFQLNENSTREERTRYIQSLKDQYLGASASILGGMQTPIIAPSGGGMSQLGSTLFSNAFSKWTTPTVNQGATTTSASEYNPQWNTGAADTGASFAGMGNYNPQWNTGTWERSNVPVFSGYNGSGPSGQYGRFGFIVK